MNSPFFDSKTKIFISGFLVGAFLTFLFLTTAFMFYKLGQRGANLSPRYVAQKVKNKLNIPTIQKGGVSDINLSFEEREIEWFTPWTGLTTEKSRGYATNGVLSLMAKFPPTSGCSGLGWEVYKTRDSLNFSDKNAFCFDVYNANEKNITLYTKFKSGANYPKRTYERTVTLIPEQITKVKIPMSELKSQLDISQISYINLFLSHPHNEVTLYFDNIRAE